MPFESVAISGIRLMQDTSASGPVYSPDNKAIVTNANFTNIESGQPLKADSIFAHVANTCATYQANPPPSPFIPVKPTVESIAMLSAVPSATCRQRSFRANASWSNKWNQLFKAYVLVPGYVTVPVLLWLSHLNNNDNFDAGPKVRLLRNGVEYQRWTNNLNQADVQQKTTDLYFSSLLRGAGASQEQIMVEWQVWGIPGGVLQNSAYELSAAFYSY